MPSESQKKPLKLLCAGRQFIWKNPYNIILAVGTLQNVSLLCVGDGPKRISNQKLAKEICPNRVHFLPKLDNLYLLKKITKSDAIILNTYFHEWSKVMIEAMLLGTPIIVNYESASKVQEISSMEGICEFCQDSPKGYASAIEKMRDDDYRKNIGERAKKMAWKLANPKRMEALQARAILNTAQKQIKNE